jgi:hypothetical protein
VGTAFDLFAIGDAFGDGLRGGQGFWAPVMP